MISSGFGIRSRAIGPKIAIKRCRCRIQNQPAIAARVKVAFNLTLDASRKLSFQVHANQMNSVPTSHANRPQCQNLTKQTDTPNRCILRAKVGASTSYWQLFDSK
jgi:hypothetical protein